MCSSCPCWREDTRLLNTKCFELRQSMDVKEPTGEPQFVGTKEELIAAQRSCRTIDGRDILILYHQGVFYALDAYCHHAGAPLQTGDIEELGGKLCLICPRHKYKMALADGEGVYKAIKPKEKPPVARWFSKGIKQRTHTLTETEGNIYVALSLSKTYIDSDFFQGEKGKAARAKNAAEAAADGLSV